MQLYQTWRGSVISVFVNNAMDTLSQTFFHPERLRRQDAEKPLHDSLVAAPSHDAFAATP